jgi:hypothetical protein
MLHPLKKTIKSQEILVGDNSGDSKESLGSYTIWYNTFWLLGNALSSFKLFSVMRILGLQREGV